MTFTNFIKRPVLSTVISIFFVLLGAIGLVSLPIERYPDIAPPTISIMTSYQGADAQTVLNSVITPLEESINGVENMTYMQSTATNNGTAMITVYFKQGSDPDMAAVNVQNRVSQAQALLPAEVTRVGVTVSKRQTSNVVMYSLTTDDGRYDDEFLTNYNNINIVPMLKRISGVGDVQTPGVKTYSMRIWLQPEKMKQYGLVPSDISGALAEQNIEAAPGSFGEQSNLKYEYTMRYKGRLKTPEEYGNIIISSNTNGQTLHLRDVAKVEMGGLQYSVAIKNNNRPAVIGMVNQIAGSNATDIANNVKAALADAQKQMPPGMKVTIEQDVTEFLFASIEEVIRTLIITLVLVFFVVYVFLQDFRSTLIPMIAVPVALIGTFFFLWVFGFSINLLTLSALLLAIAIVVDDAIVVIEAVNVKIAQEGLEPLEATQKAMKEISGAIVAVTLVMASVFIPVAFMGGPEGMFYRQFSITIASGIVLSGFTALTLTPSLCALILTRERDNHIKKTWLNRVLDKFNTGFDKGIGGYRNVLQHTVSRKIITLPLLLLFCIGAFFINNSLPSGFIPQEDQGMIYAVIETPPGATIERTNKVAHQLASIIAKEDGVESVSSLAGYEILSEGTSANSGSCLINLKPWKERSRTAKEIINDLENKCKQITDANIEFFEPPSIPGYGAASGFELRLLDKTGSNDYHAMEKVSKSFVSALNKRPEIGSAFTFYSASFPQYMLRVDNDIAAQKGITLGTAMDNLSTLIGSDYETGFVRFGKPYKVIVQADPKYRAFPQDLMQLNVKNNQGEMVPYADFLHMEKVYGMSEMTRHNLYNSAEVTGSAAAGYSSGQAIKAIEEVATSTLPHGYDYDFAGITKDEVDQGNQALIIFIVCLTFVYLILSAQYENFLLPLPIITCLPAGICGTFIFLKLTGLENNIYAQVAMVMLIGLLGKNAVLMVEYAVQRHNLGKSIRAAAIEGAAARFRPILMTSFAFIAGLLPLVFAHGAGAIGNRTIGTAAAGGMLFGTCFGLILVPGLYYIFGRMADHVKMVRYQRNKPLTEEKDKRYKLENDEKK